MHVCVQATYLKFPVLLQQNDYMIIFSIFCILFVLHYSANSIHIGTLQFVKLDLFDWIFWDLNHNFVKIYMYIHVTYNLAVRLLCMRSVIIHIVFTTTNRFLISGWCRWRTGIWTCRFWRHQWVTLIAVHVFQCVVPRGKCLYTIFIICTCRCKKYVTYNAHEMHVHNVWNLKTYLANPQHIKLTWHAWTYQ